MAVHRVWVLEGTMAWGTVVQLRDPDAEARLAAAVTATRHRVVLWSRKTRQGRQTIAGLERQSSITGAWVSMDSRVVRDRPANLSSVDLSPAASAKTPARTRPAQRMTGHSS